MTRPQFHSDQAAELAQAFRKEGVEYLFLGKSGAILLGYPGTTQDVDVFPEKSPENGRRIVKALRRLKFKVNRTLEREIVSGRDFVQIKSGPFDVDLIFAPDGIASFAAARQRELVIGGAHVANLIDIIASKRASGRTKDMIELPLLKSFLSEYEKRHTPRLQSSAEIAGKRRGGAPKK